MMSLCKVRMTPHIHTRASEGWHTDGGYWILRGVNLGNNSEQTLYPSWKRKKHCY